MTISSRTPEGQPNHCPLCEAEVRLLELALKRGPRCVEPALGENALARSETRVGERDDGSAGERDAD